MRFPDLLAMSLNNLKRRKLRTALTVLGVIIGTASIVVMVSLGIGLSKLNEELVGSYGSLTAVEVSQGESNSDDSEPKYVTDEAIRKFERIKNVKSVYPILEVAALFRQGMYESSATLTGVPHSYMEQIPLGKGRLPADDGSTLELLAGNRVIQWFSNTKTGKGYWETGELPDVDLINEPLFVTLDMEAYQAAQDPESGKKPPKKYIMQTCGMVAGGEDDFSDYSFSVYTDLNALEAKLKKIFKNKVIPGQPTTKKGKALPYMVYNRAIVNVDSMDHVMEVQKILNDQGYQAYSNMEWMEQSKQQSRMIQTVLGGIGAVSLFVAAIGIANTMMMSIYERTKEIGVIKVLGCDMRVIRNMFLIESGFIGFMGGIIGLALSYSISFALNRLLTLGQSMTGMEGDISRIPLWLSLFSIGFAVVVGMIAGFFPSLRAMKLSPLAAIRNE